MTVRPINDSVIIKLDVEDEKTKGGLYKPQGANEHVFRTGVVQSVGPGEISKKGKHLPVGVEPGDRVLFIRFVATHTETAKSVRQIIGEEEALIHGQDILAIVSEDFVSEIGHRRKEERDDEEGSSDCGGQA